MTEPTSCLRTPSPIALPIAYDTGRDVINPRGNLQIVVHHFHYRDRARFEAEVLAGDATVAESLRDRSWAGTTLLAIGEAIKLGEIDPPDGIDPQAAEHFVVDLNSFKCLGFYQPKIGEKIVLMMQRDHSDHLWSCRYSAAYSSDRTVAPDEALLRGIRHMIDIGVWR